jgi:hypothetical protein
MARRIDLLHESIGDIVSSPNVEGFRIGITGNPETRLASYRVWAGCPIGFALLAWGLTCDQAVFTERLLFERLRSHKKYDSGSPRHHLPSVNRRFGEQYLYVVWW